MLQKTGIIFLSTYLLVLACGFNLVKHHCSSCHKTTYALWSESTCNHSKNETKHQEIASDVKSCCAAKKHSPQRAPSTCPSCKNEKFYIQLDEKFLLQASKEVALNPEPLDCLYGNLNLPVLAGVHKTHIPSNCGPPFTVGGRFFSILFHSLKLDC